MLTIAAVADGATRDLPECLARATAHVRAATDAGAGLLVLPEAYLGGYLAALGDHGDTGAPEAQLPPALALDGPELAQLAAAAGDLVVCVGLCERGEDGRRYNTAVALSGDGVLARYRKVHQPLGEGAAYASGGAGAYRAVDTPVGRLGLQVCYDKCFPEAARALALDGAQLVVSLSAWPAARTAAAERLEDDRWTHRFDLCDRARALDNQVFWVASNQAGAFGSLRFVGRAKVVDPGGAVLAATGTGGGTALATVDLEAGLAAARAGMHHLRDRRPDAYGPPAPPTAEPAEPAEPAGPLAAPVAGAARAGVLAGA